MNNNLKILFVTHLASRSGAELGLFELILALKKKNVECLVVFPSHGVALEDYQKNGIKYEIIPHYWWVSKGQSIKRTIYYLFLNIISAIKIGILAKKFKADFIYSSTIAIPSGAMAARLFRLKHVWHIHEFGQEDHNLIFDWGKKISYFILNKATDICLVNSKAVFEKFKKIIRPDKISVVYYSVSIPDWLKNPPLLKFREEGNNCLIIGQLQEGKGQEDAVRAMGELKKRGVIARLSIAGGGDINYKKRLLVIIKEKKLKKFINFLGYNPNPLEFYRESDIVLVCSRAEAFGRVTVEAMKLGRPVIGAEAGGTKELIKDGFNGLLYKAGDYKELALKIKLLLSKPLFRQKMGDNARKWSLKKFTPDNYGSSVYKILKRSQTFNP